MPECQTTNIKTQYSITDASEIGHCIEDSWAVAPGTLL